MDNIEFEYIPVTQGVEPYTLRIEIFVSPDGRLVIHPIDEPIVAINV